MVLFNYSTKELTAKIVYYGPGLCGKTTNLQFIHENLSPNVKGKMLSLATKTDRTLFFDFLPMDLGEIRGMKTRMQLYTVPGQVFYNETRKLVLKGVDGIVFVADSQKEMLGPNIESFKNLEENLKGHGYKLAEMPHVIQFNKRDLPKLASVEELNAAINKFNAPFYETVATTGIGVQDSLKAITKLVLLHLTKKYDPRTGAPKQASAGSAKSKAKSKTTKQPAVKPKSTKVPVAEPAQVPVAAAAVSVGGTKSIPLSGVGAGAQSTQTASAVATPTAESSIPLSTNEMPVLDAPGPETTTPAPKADFAAAEIDDLVGEVEDIQDVAPTLSATEEPEAISIEDPQDSRADEPEGVPEIQLKADVTPSETLSETSIEAPRIEVNVEAVPGEDREESTSESTVDLLSVSDLFQDSSLEIAHLAAGQQREIVIPVQIAGEGESFKRYKLSLRLKLDNVD